MQSGMKPVRAADAKKVCAMSPQDWKTLRGLEIHGLLVGKPSSIPLDMICSHVHNFLSKYDPMGVTSSDAASPVSAKNRNVAAAGDPSRSAGHAPSSDTHYRGGRLILAQTGNLWVLTS